MTLKLEDTDKPKEITPQNLGEVMQSIYDHAKSMGLHVYSIYCETDSGVEINKSWSRE